MAFRQYRRASSGVDAGVHALLFWLTIVTAPIWVPVLLIVGAYNSCVSNTPAAKAERARIEAQHEAERAAEMERGAQQQRRVQETAMAAAHAPWDALRCEALFVRLGRAIRLARSGSDSAAVDVSALRQQASDHGCKK